MISRNGEVKNAATEKSCEQPSLSNETYSRVSLRLATTKSKYRSIGVHILVACAFIPVPDEKLSILDKLSIDHENRDTRDNRDKNLRWLTAHEQMLNRGPQKPGRLWIQNNCAFFTDEDFQKFGNVNELVDILQPLDAQFLLSLSNLLYSHIFPAFLFSMFGICILF